jgi:hypothetical protein
MGGMDVCPRLKTKKDLLTSLEEIKTSTEPRDVVKSGRNAAEWKQLRGSREGREKITLKHLPCDRFVV